MKSPAEMILSRNNSFMIDSEGDDDLTREEAKIKNPYRGKYTPNLALKETNSQGELKSLKYIIKLQDFQFSSKKTNPRDVEGHFVSQF